MPYFAPFTGALLARPKARNVMNIRASYPDEAEQLVQHLATIGIRKIGIAYQNNAFGKEVFEGAKAAMERHKLTDLTAVTVENNASDAGAAAGKLAAATPEAVLVGLAGKPTLDFVKAIRAQRRGLPLYALSVMGAAATLRALGDDAVGIAVFGRWCPPPPAASCPSCANSSRPGRRRRWRSSPPIWRWRASSMPARSARCCAAPGATPAARDSSTPRGT